MISFRECIESERKMDCLVNVQKTIYNVHVHIYNVHNVYV